MADGRYGDRAGHGRRDSIFSDNEHDRERGFFQRAGEEVRSWFGDEEDGERSSRSNYGDYESGGARGEGSYESGYQGHGGAGRGGGSEQGRGSQGSRGGSSPFDDHYLSWRERHVSQLDRDYEEYCRERQQRFESDFHGWRQSRQGQVGGTGGMTVSQSGVTSGRTQSSDDGSGAATGSVGSDAPAGTTAGGGGDLSATESSTGSSAVSGSGASTGSRKSQERK